MKTVLPLLLLLLAACNNERKLGANAKWLPPDKAMASMKLAEDFHVELFAAEPDVVDPVDIAFDEFGRAYVTEMLDLPDDPPPGKPARGRIRMLEDTNGDGKADKATMFAENLMHASGLMPWKGGLIVPASPDILYLKDTDGDGKADIRETWFTGFFHGNPEAQITNPRLNVDNWIHFSNTGNEGLVKSPKYPNQPAVQMRGFDFRFHPSKGLFEPASGNAQYGATFDDWGNRFISQNTTHLRHVVLPRHYIARAPTLEAPALVHDVYNDHHREMYPVSEPQEWRILRTKLRQERYNELKTGRVEHLSGHITGATGSTMYSGDTWPAEYVGNIFTADVSGNLIRRDIVTPDGATFKAVPAPKTEKERVEFLASTDQWFRPTNFANAPDGNLYFTDMQRETIETPLSIPDEMRKKIDFYSGDTLGRIYRIVPNKPRGEKRGLKVNLGAMSVGELVKTLEHPNGWHRVTAHRLLLEKLDPRAAVGPLREAVAKSQVPQARLRALYLLDAHGVLEQALVQAALKDAEPRVREHAIRMAEAHPALEREVLALLRDADPRIQLQLALSLGNFRTTAARAAVVEIAAKNQDDKWFRLAGLSSAADDPARFYAALAAKGPVNKDLTALAASLIGTRKQPAEIQNFVPMLAKSKDPDSGLAGLARGLRLVGARGLKAPGIEAALSKYLNDGVESAWDVAQHFEIKGLVDRAAADAVSTTLESKKRAVAVAALRGAGYAQASAVIERVMASNPPADVQSAAVLTLSSFENPEVALALLSRWKNYGPEARPKVIGALLAQKGRVPALLNALENEAVPLNALETGARNRLLELSDPALVARAKKILQTSSKDRAQVIASFQDALKLNGRVEHGKRIFEETCAKCHLPRKQGARIGPDLSGINMKTKEELLAAILDPSASIEPRFVNYLVTAKDGRMYDGVIASETPGAVTLRGGAEDNVTLLRTYIAEIRASALSLMPEGLEQKMSKQDLADLIAYLQGGL